jgi:hypothetical protein
VAALRRFLLASTLACVGFIAGACTSAPGAPDRDVLAKEFLTHPAASAIYVYRSEFNYFDTDTMLYIDGRVVGSTAPGTYFRIDTTPGRHVLHGSGIDVGEFALETRAGQVRIVELNVIGGHSNFRVMPDEAGRERVRACCALLENWAPRLRPLVLR